MLFAPKRLQFPTRTQDNSDRETPGGLSAPMSWFFQKPVENVVDEDRVAGQPEVVREEHQG